MNTIFQIPSNAKTTLANNMSTGKYINLFEWHSNSETFNPHSSIESMPAFILFFINKRARQATPRPAARRETKASSDLTVRLTEGVGLSLLQKTIHRKCFENTATAMTIITTANHCIGIQKNVCLLFRMIFSLVLGSTSSRPGLPLSLTPTNQTIAADTKSAISLT